MKMIREIKAFTLIEILVVVTIIGILAGIVVINVENSRATARDARRVSDLNSLQSGLLMFYESKKAVLTSACGNQDFSVNDVNLNHFLVSGGYLPSMPKDPKYTSGEKDYHKQYLYVSTNSNITTPSPQNNLPGGCTDFTDDANNFKTISAYWYIFATLETDKYTNMNTASTYVADHIAGGYSVGTYKMYFLRGPN